MDSITVMRKVLIKSIVTDELKHQLDMQLDTAINNAQQAIKDVEKQKKAFLKGKKQLTSIEQNTVYNMDLEIGKHMKQLEDFTDKKKNYAKMKDGSEFIQGVVDSPCEMRIGDSFFERLSQAEIVLNDGEIVEISNI